MSLATIRFTPSMSQDQLMMALNQNFALLENVNVSQTFKDQDGVNRIILGKLPDDTYGFIISKPGVDVNTLFDS